MMCTRRLFLIDVHLNIRRLKRGEIRETNDHYVGQVPHLKWIESVRGGFSQRLTWD